MILNPEAVGTNGNKFSENLFSENLFSYTGHVYEESSGLYYAKARYYDAKIGRFISEDSYRGEQGEPITLNFYIYVNNNPIRYIDPSGYYTLEEGKIAHQQLQIFFMALYGNGFNKTRGYVEYTINSGVSINKSGKGRVDLVLLINQTYELYEIKPYSQRIKGREQLTSYINAMKESGKKVKKGQTFNPNGLELPYTLNPNKVIKYYTYPNDPGMIYYNIVNKKNKEEYVTVKEKEHSFNVNKAIESGAIAVTTVGTGYVIYRVVRMLPSLIPGMWWSIPANAVTP